LTPAELEILRWASEGKTVWEISQIRATSEATVKFHLRNIYGKSGSACAPPWSRQWTPAATPC
ncbi:helix-turn-helix domain-containing protein, partial [Pseudomonas sp. SIMBA_068]|uniref:helix-turn-helix domain-containing protein n=1 Tax=Pseudomonas sp. SIMBA_068 TaxID=3085808 RepID=UPI003979342C